MPSRNVSGFCSKINISMAFCFVFHCFVNLKLSAAAFLPLWLSLVCGNVSYFIKMHGELTILNIDRTFSLQVNTGNIVPCKPQDKWQVNVRKYIVLLEIMFHMGNHAGQIWNKWFCVWFLFFLVFYQYWKDGKFSAKFKTCAHFIVLCANPMCLA